MKEDRPLVRVARAEKYRTRNHPTGTYSYLITLECGHYTGRKGSQGVPKRVRCGECLNEMVSAGVREIT